LGALLRRAADVHAARIALVAGDSCLTYAELDSQVDCRAAGLHEYGIRAGDRVVVQLPNMAEFVIICFALFRIGACPVFSLPAYRGVEVGHLFRIASPVAYVIPAIYLGVDYRGLAATVIPDFPALRHVFVVGDPGPYVAAAEVTATPREFPEPDPADVALFLLSGGTTALPKLIPRTHDDYGYQVRASAQICGLTKNSVDLVALPIEFNFPWGCPGVMGTLYTGGKVVLALESATDEHFELIERERVTFTSLVPTTAHLWLDELPWTTRDLSSLTMLQVGGATLHIDTAKRIVSEFKCTLQQVYGMAEGLLCFTRVDDPPETVLNTQGRPISSGDELLVIDADNREVPAGEVGELVTRGPYTLRGYYWAREHNSVSFTADGFYRTGDLVRVLADGYVIVVGRVKDVITRGGDKVSAAEVEGYLIGQPGVAQAAVVPVPDAVLGERTCACVVPEGTAPTLVQLRSALRERGIADYKLPDRLEIVCELPVTGLGKMDKKRLAAELAQRVEAP
jgi:2,3-dihydroxybenzoate-AMP ligase